MRLHASIPSVGKKSSNRMFVRGCTSTPCFTDTREPSGVVPRSPAEKCQAGSRKNMDIGIGRSAIKMFPVTAKALGIELRPTARPRRRGDRMRSWLLVKRTSALPRLLMLPKTSSPSDRGVGNTVQDSRRDFHRRSPCRTPLGDRHIMAQRRMQSVR